MPIRKLSGFMSRWMKPLLCTNSMRLIICTKNKHYGNNENSYCIFFFTPEQNLWENFCPSFTQDTVKSAKTVKFSPFHLHLIFPVTVTPFKFCYGTWFETTKYRSKTSKPEITFPFSAFPVSALTLLVKRQEGHPACEKNWVLVCWWWHFA